MAKKSEPRVPEGAAEPRLARKSYYRDQDFGGVEGQLWLLREGRLPCLGCGSRLKRSPEEVRDYREHLQYCHAFFDECSVTIECPCCEWENDIIGYDPAWD